MGFSRVIEGFGWSLWEFLSVIEINAKVVVEKMSTMSFGLDL